MAQLTPEREGEGGMEGLVEGLGMNACLFRPWDTPESLSPSSGQSLSPSSSERTSPSSSSSPTNPSPSSSSSSTSSPPSLPPQAVYDSEGSVLFSLAPLTTHTSLPPPPPPAGKSRRRRANAGVAASPVLARKSRPRYRCTANPLGPALVLVLNLVPEVTLTLPMSLSMSLLLSLSLTL